jgi:tetratricopeptide (TPR) repeat protein
MRYFLSLLLILLCCFSLSAQKKGKEYFLVDSVNYDSLPAGDKVTLDSLLPLYHAAVHDTTRLRILVSLAEGVSTETLWPRYNSILYKKAEQLLKDPGTLSPAELRSIKKSYAMSLQDKGFFEENYNGNIPAALDYYYKCEKIQKEIGDKKNLAMTLNNIGIAFHSQGNVEKSLEYYMQSVKMQEELNDKLGMAYGLNNMASTYIEQGDTAKAIEYQQKSMKLREGEGDKHGLAISLSNLAAIYNNKGEPEKALGYFNRCVKLWETLGEKQGLAYCLRYLGVIYQRKAELLKSEGKTVPDTLIPKAIEYMLKSLQLYQSIGDKRGESLILVIIGDHYLYEKNIPRALFYGGKALAISKEISYPLNLRNASLLMYKIYKVQQKWKEALSMYELTIQMKDSVSNEETKKSVFKQQTKYEYEKQEALKAVEHQKELAVAEEGKKRQVHRCRIVNACSFLGLYFQPPAGYPKAKTYHRTPENNC